MVSSICVSISIQMNKRERQSARRASVFGTSFSDRRTRNPVALLPRYLAQTPWITSEFRALPHVVTTERQNMHHYETWVLRQRSAKEGAAFLQPPCYLNPLNMSIPIHLSAMCCGAPLQLRGELFGVERLVGSFARGSDFLGGLAGNIAHTPRTGSKRNSVAAPFDTDALVLTRLPVRPLRIQLQCRGRSVRHAFWN